MLHTLYRSARALIRGNGFSLVCYFVSPYYYVLLRNTNVYRNKFPPRTPTKSHKSTNKQAHNKTKKWVKNQLVTTMTSYVPVHYMLLLYTYYSYTHTQLSYNKLRETPLTTYYV